MSPRDWRTVARRMEVTPRIVTAVVLALLLISVVVGVFSDRANRRDAARGVGVQAEILASSVAGALAFDDRQTAQEYLDALAANPDVRMAAAYRLDGTVLARLDRSGPAPADSPAFTGTRYSGGSLEVSIPVRQGSTDLGRVYLSVATESWPARLARYLAVAAIIVMASLLIVVLGSSHVVLAETNRRLETETEERRLAEEALRQSQKMEAMGQLTGGVAHDFNNLLMVASSGLDLLERTDDPARRKMLKDGIRQAIDRGASLTQQLLAFARRAPVKPEVIHPGMALRGMKALLDRSLREDVSVELEIGPDVWPIEVDPSAFEVAILNMAINARDAMPAGGTVRIHAENVPAGADRTRDGVRVSIIDTGEGLAPEVAARVFEPFFTTKGIGRGTGLGLSQVYGFVKSSDGEVDFKSEVGKGTTVCMLLPRSAKPLPVPLAPQDLPSMPSHRKPRVLMVEDDDNVASLVSEMLSELGYEHVRASAAHLALDTLKADSGFDLVFSDMVMPGDMTGLDLAEAIAVAWPHIPVVLTTGYSSAAASAANKGIRLLVKPYRMDTLARELAAALQTTATLAGPSS